MTARLKLLASGLLAAGTLWGGSVAAAPAAPHGIAAEHGAFRAETVQWHNHRQGHRGWNRGGWNRGGWGGGPGLSFGFGVGAPYAYGGYGYGAYDSYGAYGPYDEGYAAVPLGQSRTDDDDEAYCQQRFRSYDPSSGTYLGYDGQRHPCP